ncbi:hypothetical protein Cme02nite_26360 [Catellatospora methionotrophica]|uniref:Cyanobacterial TRADD-N associated 2 transmembrane domain-containing protein n=2 Tax=Catellatospora methionotrophica TaxID=121620 RepID=A0A8J3LF04_9ACTN|nr:hypothetical protein Cme02nite_26360 [Catellatospora methionotrophica]
MTATWSDAMARVAFYEKIESDAISAAGQAIRDVTGGSDTVGLLNANQRQMEAYASIARSQAATSYRASQVAMGAGLVLLVIGGACAYFITDPAAKIATATLAGVGTLVGGYISRTYIAVQYRAMEQMTYYFREPQVQSYILTAERIAHQLDAEERSQALGSIIDATLSRLLENPEEASARGSGKLPTS